MIRLHEFITKIRNCKTIAEERAEYQKEMSAIRESFGKNEEALRPRNVTKLLFINMSGQETNFGQMECLKLITANSLIEKRIGYLGLTQLFHQKSELLMMATNRIRIDLNGVNNNIVSLTLCVLSEICTAELARDLHQDVLKCISNTSAYIRKKAILTSIKLVKRVPEYIPEFLPKIATCLEEKSHGVLLSCLAFLENVMQIDESYSQQLVELVPKIARAYRMIAQDHNAEYQIGGVQDPFLQVAILKFLRTLKKHSNTFDKQLSQILVICHDSVCNRVSANLKNGANAVLFECFQCFMLLQPTKQLRDMVANVLSKFISVKDANSKYLSLFNLNLMTKYDLKIVRSHKATIFECLNQNDILIRIMALDLLYVIAAPDNTPAIIKELLNVLLSATDEQFITELALKICLIVEKHSQNRRWHFDTILKVLILADQAVKEESAKSLVYLVQSTPPLQEYCLAKLFFSASENPQNNALSGVTLFLIGELVDILFRIKGISITEQNVLDLIENIIFKVGIANDTIAYGLSTLLKLYEKFSSRDRIVKMIRSFETHSDLQVQKRACEYAKLLESIWDQDRKKQILVTVPPFKQTVESFRGIPVGEIQMDIDLNTLKLPDRLGVNYEDHITKTNEQQQESKYQNKQKQTQRPVEKPVTVPQEKPKPKQTNIMDDDIFNSIVNAPTEAPKSQPPPQPQQGNLFDSGLGGISFQQTPPVSAPTNSDPYGILGLNVGGSQPVQVSNPSGFGGDLLGFGSSPAPTTTPPPQSNFLGGDLMGFGVSPSPQTTNLGGFGFNPTPVNTNIPTQQPPQTGFGFNLLGSSTTGVTNPPPPTSLSQSVPVPPTQSVVSGFQPIINNNPNKILAYQNQHIQIWMDCIKQGNDTTKLFTTYVNKTNSSITDITIQAAVLKHVKLTINPLNSTTLQPFSKQVVHQSMIIVNSMVGQKGVVMKVKISYSIANQKFNFEQKISNFPNNV